MQFATYPPPTKTHTLSDRRIVDAAIRRERIEHDECGDAFALGDPPPEVISILTVAGNDSGSVWLMKHHDPHTNCGNDRSFPDPQTWREILLLPPESEATTSLLPSILELRNAIQLR